MRKRAQSLTSYVAYRVRTYIGKHLTNRVQAIRTGVVKLNAAARALTPPRPTIPINDVLAKTFIGELDLLRDSRNDIREKPWADPQLRTFIDQYFRLTHAKEEIKRLNVEMRRVRTWIRDDETLTKSVIKQLEVNDPDLAYEIASRLSLKSRVNNRIWKQLDEVESWKAFSGVRGCGVGPDSLPNALPFPIRTSFPRPSTTSTSTPLDAAEPGSSDGSSDEEERERNMEGLADVMPRLAA